MKNATIALVMAGSLAAASLAFAASTDYLLVIEGVPGESSTSGQVLSWSWGTSNAGSSSTAGMGSGRVAAAPRDAASGLPTGKRMHKPMPMPMAVGTLPAQTAAGGVHVAAGDVDGDGRADLMVATTRDAIEGFTLTFDKASPVLAKVCTGKHFDKVELRRTGQVLVIENAAATCKPAAGKSGAACTSGGDCDDAAVAVTLTGQMKHTKTGHVTLLK